jgi:hypothetical protein
MKRTTADIAVEYHAAGWHPIELPAKAKEKPRTGLTGYGGVDMTIEQITAARWAGNIGLRMPRDVIGIDVDAYHDGDKTLAEMVERLGPLPPTKFSHSNRGDGSGIFFFRVPAGMSWITGLPGIEIIQQNHRYSMAWPSIHPEDRRYDWGDQAEDEPVEGVPAVGELPELPWPWIGELSRSTAAEAESGARSQAASLDEVRRFIEAHTAADLPGYISTIVDRFTDKTGQGRSRHDTMQHCLIFALEHVMVGVAPAESTIKQFAELWVEAMADDRRRAELHSDRRTTEFDAMVRHAVGKANAKTDDERFHLRNYVVGPTMRPGKAPSSNGSAPPDDEMAEPDEDQDGGVMLLVDWLTVGAPVDHLVDGFAGAGLWTQLVAPAKGGKSTLLVAMSVELSEGRDPFDGSPIDPVVVLYADGEMGPADVAELIEACGHDPLALTRLYVADERPRLDTPKGAARLLACVEAIGARVVVLDGLNGFIDPDASENDDTPWRRLYTHTIVPLKRLNVTILSGDNMGKDRTKGSRGSSVKADKADVVFQLTKLDSGVRLRPTHRRARFTSADVDLSVVGLDRSEPIVYRRAAGWVPGTKDAVALLDRLGVPTSDGRDKVRKRLRAEITAAEAAGQDPAELRVRNDALAAAIRFRRQPPPAPSGTTP